MVASSRRNSRNSPTVMLRDGAESFLVEGVENEAGDIVFGRIDQRAADNFIERQVCKFAFRGDSLSFRSRGDAGQLVAGFLLVGFGKQFAEIGEVESLDHGQARFGDTMLPKKPERALAWLRDPGGTLETSASCAAGHRRGKLSRARDALWRRDH